MGAQAQERRVPAGSLEARLSLAPVVTQASPAVVNIYATRITRGGRMSGDPFFRRFGQGVAPERLQQALGSGVIVRADGVIVTNNHVVEGADALKVVLADRREFDARLILADPRTDLAVLRIETGGERLTALTYADTRAAQVGDFVIAIGNPFGLQQTVTSGIISALARTEVGINDFSFFVQTDAAINRGNSGGALVDLAGNLVGVNTAIFSEGGGSNGIGFAIPAEMVQRVVDSALSTGRVVRPWLGVRTQAITAETARTVGLDRPRGVMVTHVHPDGAAQAAGLRSGDIVLAVEGVEVRDDAALRFQVATARPGTRLRVALLRNGAQREVMVLADPPPRSPAPNASLMGQEQPLAGAVLANLSPALAEELGVDGFETGVVIQAVETPQARRLGLRAGDLVRVVNGVPVASVREVAAIPAPPNRVWRVVIERGGARLETAYRF